MPVLITGTNAQLLKQNNPWLIRVHVHDGQLADALPHYVIDTMKKQRPAILTVSDDYGLGAAKGLQATFDKIKVKTVAVESYGLNDKDMSAQLTKIKNANADVLVLFGRPGDVALVMKQRKALAFSKRVLDRNRIPADNFALGYRDGMYILKSVIEKVGCDGTRMRDELHALKDWKGLLITYTADKDGDLAHTLGVYRNKGKTTELVGTIYEPGA